MHKIKPIEKNRQTYANLLLLIRDFIPKNFLFQISIMYETEEAEVRYMPR